MTSRNTSVQRAASLFPRTPSLRPAILAALITPAALDLAPRAEAATLVLNPTTSPLVFDADNAPTIYAAGLRESVFTNQAIFDPNTYDPANNPFENGTQNPPTLGTRMGNSNQGDGNNADSPLTEWGLNRVFAYKGQVFVGPEGRIQFAEHIDDVTYLYIDGVTYLSNIANDPWNTPTATGIISLASGWYDFEVRFGNGGGGAGPTNSNNNGGSNWGGSVGFVYSTSETPGGLDRNNYLVAVDDGTMNLFRYAAGVGFDDDIVVEQTGGVVQINGVVQPGVAQRTLTFNSTNPTLTISGAGKTLSLREGTLINQSNATITINGDGNLNAGEITDNLNTNVNIIKDGTGDLIIEHTATPNDLDGSRFQVNSGRMVVTGAGGVNPIATLTQPIQLNGGTLVLNNATLGGTVNFVNSVDVTANSEIAHTTNSNDTLGTGTAGISISSGRTLSANISAGSLLVNGPVGGAGAILVKSGAGVLRVDGPLTLASAPTLDGGTLFLANSGNNFIGSINVPEGATLASAKGALGTTNTVNLTGGTFSTRGFGTDGTAAINGFGDGTGFTLNRNAAADIAGAGTIVNGVYQATTNTNNQATTAWFNTPVNLQNGFIARFTFTSSPNGADGSAFILQNEFGSLNALGPEGGGFGYGGITSSAALQFNIWNGSPGNNGGVGAAYNVNGQTMFDANPPNERATNLAPVQLAGGNPIEITIAYRDGVLRTYFIDSITGASASLERNLNNDPRGTIESTIQGTSALVGFSGGTGGINAPQQFANFRFSDYVPFENFGTNVNVAAGTSTINSNFSAAGVQLGTVAMSTGANLNVTGVTPTRFANTTFQSAGTYSFNIASNDTDLGNIAVTGGGALTLNKSGAGGLAFPYTANPALPVGSTINVSGGSVKVQRGGAGVDPLGGATVNINQGGSITVEAPNSTHINTATVNVSGGTIRAASGVSDFTNSAALNISAFNPGVTNDALAGKLFPAQIGLGINGPGINNAASRLTPAFTNNLTSAFTFGPIFGGDGPIATFFGAPGSATDTFTMVFVGEYTADATGTHQFGFRNNDDGASFWVDLNRNGIFELDGSNGSERIANADGCCPNFNEGTGNSDFIQGAADLFGGQSYKFAIALQDNAGGSSLDGYFQRPSDFDLTLIDPSVQPNTWRAINPTGGANLQIDAAAELRLSDQTNIVDAAFAGNDGKLLFNAASTAANRVEVLRTPFANTENTIEVGANNTVTVGNLSNVNGATLVKAGAGALVADNQSLGTGSNIEVQAGLLHLKGGANATSGGAFVDGSLTVAGGIARVDGSIAGAVFVQNGGRLEGIGSVGAVAVASGGTLAPGTSPGTLSSGALTLDSGSNFSIELLSPAVLDRVNVTGSVTLSGANLQLSILGGASGDIGSLFFIVLNDGADAITGTFAGLAQGQQFNASGFDFEISYIGDFSTSSFTGGNDVVLRALSPVPEPTTFAALTGGLGLLLGIGRFRKRRA
jgi:hypothetical protein